MNTIYDFAFDLFYCLPFQTLMNVLQTRVARYVRTLPEATSVAVTQDFDWLEPPSVRIMTSVPPL